MIGTRLGPYEITAKLGEGGMGEVYRAHDTKLKRDVAIKVLPAAFTEDRERLARFEREAQLLAQLHHPNIASIFGLEDSDGSRALVMELVEGPTLAERLEQGGLPFNECLSISLQIAQALEEAHEKGIVHRDLKPQNVKASVEGKVKVLDFGLAKALDPIGSSGLSPADLAHSPTMTLGATREGMILGTAAYMSPEQAKGLPVDKRADIWAFGVVLYEMLVGRSLFAGETVTDTLAGVLKGEIDFAELPSSTPPVLQTLLRRCLERDPRRRLRDIGEARLALDELDAVAGSVVPASGLHAATAGHAAPLLRRGLPWAIALLAGLAAVGLALRKQPSTAAGHGRLQLSIVPPELTVLTEFFSISPDGKTLAFGGISGGKSLLRLRELGAERVRALEGTDSAETVFWSPDGHSLGFVARGKLRRMELATGATEVLADADLGRGGSWGATGDILFTQKAVGVISRVPAVGGTTVPVTALEPGDLLHRWPQVLPGGDRFLYFVKTDQTESTGTYLSSLSKPGRKLLLRSNGVGVFVAPDKLLFVRGATLLAQGVDLARGELRGEPVEVAQPVLRGDLGSYRDLFSVSDTGIVAFQAGSAERQLRWVDRDGKTISVVGATAEILSAGLSPDGLTAGYTFRSRDTGLRSIATVELVRSATAPFAEGAGAPIWSPDGRKIFYRTEAGTFDIRWRAGRSGSGADPIEVTDSFATPHSVSSDGRWLLFTRVARGFDIGVKELTSEAKPQILLSTEFSERMPTFSPDGRWFAYSSDETGQAEIFVRRFPLTEEKWRISTAGGEQPIWSANGREIFFLAMDRTLMAVPVRAVVDLDAGAPQPLFHAALALNNALRQYAASADGQRFLLVAPTQEAGWDRFRVLVNGLPER